MGPTVNQAPVAPQKIGRFRKGWQMTKSSWHVLKLDKELAMFPIISFFVSLIVAIPFVILVLLNENTRHAIFNASAQSSSQTGLQGWQGLLFAFGLYFVSNLVANFFNGALIYGAVERFKGGDPSISNSIAGARAKFRPLLLFSLLMTTVGLIFQILEERLPFAGKIAAYFFDAAWSVANVFAIPVIVLSEEDVNPLDATKRSVGIIKKVWGEGIAVNIGIGLISVLSTLAYLAAVTVIAVFAGAAGLHGTVAGVATISGIGIAVLGFIALAIVFSTLSSIAKAALYYYATTGESPASFDAKLLQAAMTRKKARKIFA